VLSGLVGEAAGVKVHARIIPPTGTLSEAIASRLRSADELHEAVAAKAASVLVSNLAGASGIRVTSAGQVNIIKINPATLEPDMARAVHHRPCPNCRGVLRLRFTAPTRWAERRSQLEGLNCDQLMQRAQLCGLAHEVSNNGASQEGRKATLNLIIKSEGIIR
jgi:hypothetical protein